jgi:hypothetical protein
MLGNFWRQRSASFSIPRHPPRRASIRRFCPTVEPLEERTVLSIVLQGVPTWVAQGPDPIRFAHALVKPGLRTSTDVGAIQAVAVDPFNSDHVFVGTVNGGIWQTQNIFAADPVWTTTTDQLGSLAISSLAIDPFSSQVIYAGTGSFSAAAGRGGPAVGVYKSNDGGRTWTLLGKNTFTNLPIVKLVQTEFFKGEVDKVPPTVLAATTAGAFRSDNGGMTWQPLSGKMGLPAGSVTDLISDPSDPASGVFAAVVGSRESTGVYRLNLASGKWTNVTGNMARSVLDRAIRIQLAASAAGNHPVWAGVVVHGGFLQSVFRGVGTDWKAVGPEGKGPSVVTSQGGTHFSIVADPTHANLVYVGGQTGDESPFGGVLARGNSNTNTWTAISKFVRKDTTPKPGTVNPTPLPGVNTAPHADSRQMVFDRGEILQVDDGGIYRLMNPAGSTERSIPTWVAANGTGLQDTEFYALGLNPNGLLFGGAQDNGVALQTAEGWKEARPADGVVAFVGPDGTNYASNQQFDAFRLDAAGKTVHFFATVEGTGKTLVAFNTNDEGVLLLPFRTPFRVSAGDANLMLIGAQGGTLYLSTNKGNTSRSLGGLNDAKTAANAVQARGFDGHRHAIQGTVTVIGLGTPTDKGIAYVGTTHGEIYRSANVTREVTSDGVTSPDPRFVRTAFRTDANGARPLGLVIDPTDANRVYVLTSADVWRTDDGGNTWTRITGNLQGLITPNGAAGTALGSLALVKGKAGVSDVLLVGGLGGVFRLSNPADFSRGSFPTTWRGYGQQMPNVFVDALDYDPQTDTLAAGTLGRGAFQIVGVRNTLYASGLLVISGRGATETPDLDNPLNVIASDGLGNTQSIPRSIVQGTQILS